MATGAAQVGPAAERSRRARRVRGGASRTRRRARRTPRRPRPPTHVAAPIGEPLRTGAAARPARRPGAGPHRARAGRGSLPVLRRRGSTFPAVDALAGQAYSSSGAVTIACLADFSAALARSAWTRSCSAATPSSARASAPIVGYRFSRSFSMHLRRIACSSFGTSSRKRVIARAARRSSRRRTPRASSRPRRGRPLRGARTG